MKIDIGVDELELCEPVLLIVLDEIDMIELNGYPLRRQNWRILNNTIKNKLHFLIRHDFHNRHLYKKVCPNIRFRLEINTAINRFDNIFRNS